MSFILADTGIKLGYNPYRKDKQQKNRPVEVARLEYFGGEHIIALSNLKYYLGVLQSNKIHIILNVIFFGR